MSQTLDSTGTAMGKRRKSVPRTPRGTQYLNPPPRELPGGLPREAVMAEFGRRLQKLLVDKGWNQSDLARNATRHMPGRQVFTRDNVSNYVRGQQLPGPIRLRALCVALGVEQLELLPAHAMQSVDDKMPPYNLKSLEDGRVFLQINQVVDFGAAMKIMELLGQKNSK